MLVGAAANSRDTARCIQSPERSLAERELTERLTARALAVLPNGLSSRSHLPLDQRIVPAAGEGPLLVDVEGRSYVDYHAGAGALILGHSHPAVAAAVASQVAAGAVFFGSISQPALDLAEELVRAIPCAGKVVFTSTGSEATAYALRLARAFVGRPRYLKFDGAYHGNHDGVLAQRADVAAGTGYGVPESAGVPADIARLAVVAPYNDLDAVRACMREHGREIAAIIVEPVLRHIFPEPGFLAGLRTIADENGCLLIFDEVVTGFRLAYGGAQEYFGAVPHLACYGKIIGGGLPLGAVAGSAEIIDLCSGARQSAPDYVLHNGTHHGNPLSAAAGLATLERLRTPGFYARLHAWTAALRKELQAVAARRGSPVRVVGGASMWQLSLLADDARSYRDLLREDRTTLTRIDHALVRNGVYVLAGNRRLATSVHADDALERTARALDAACAVVA